MKPHFFIAMLACTLCFAIASLSVAGQEPPALGHTRDLVIKALPPGSSAKLKVTSPAFKEGADIPYENTQYRGNVFPGLSWTKGPAGTRSYAVIVQGESVKKADTDERGPSATDFPRNRSSHTARNGSIQW
jgi:para-nitrobenzyl esterase